MTKKTILPNGDVLPIDLMSLPRLVIESRGRKFRAVGNEIVDCGPASRPHATIITGTAHLRAAKAAEARHNAALLRDALHDLEARGLCQVVNVEVPANACSAPKMTLKQFKAAFGDKPGATFRCPDHLKHELEE